jgi:hypothetical protein
MPAIPVRTLCGVVAITSLASACGGFPKAPAYPRKDDGFSGPQQVARPGIADDRPPPLRLEPGDIISIEIQA